MKIIIAGIDTIQWADTKWEIVISILILLVSLFCFLKIKINSFSKRYNSEINKRLGQITDQSLLTLNDIRHLPKPVQDYLKITGALDKPQVKNMRVVFTGEMKTTVTGNWKEIRSEQYNFFADETRIFHINSAMYGIPFEGLHFYSKGKATMQIRIASLFKVVDASGDKMNQSETVTFFNDMCLLAPATLISKKIKWELLDPLMVTARFTQHNICISATLSFNQEGELINFTSNDRFLSEDGKTYQNLPWSTPILKYKNVNGRKQIAKAQACWQTDKGKFTYAKFICKEIEYNCTLQ